MRRKKVIDVKCKKVKNKRFTNMNTETNILTHKILDSGIFVKVSSSDESW